MMGVIGPSFRWDILNYGRILNNVRIQDARFQELAFAYQNTVLQAGAEAENSIVAFLDSQDRTRRLAASAAAAARTVEISFDQYRLGAIDFTPVVLFESTLAEQQDQLAVSQGRIALELIGTYRALGGGWQMRLTRAGGSNCVPGIAKPAGETVSEGQGSGPIHRLPTALEDKAPARAGSMQESSASAQSQAGTPRAAAGGRGAQTQAP